ncbi:MAG TPA: hypothetical protein VH249_24970 [Xanthobacteraceae bacterium]|jgi:hypothetical protein|nr:hypothetical protein [Xanthobacteraceae bacterium]
MDLDVYTVVKEAKEWTISAGGIRIIACRDRRTAIKTVRRATELLRSEAMARRRPAIRKAVPSETPAGDLQAARMPDPAGYELRTQGPP